MLKSEHFDRILLTKQKLTFKGRTFGIHFCLYSLRSKVNKHKLITNSLRHMQKKWKWFLNSFLVIFLQSEKLNFQRSNIWLLFLRIQWPLRWKVIVCIYFNYYLDETCTKKVLFSAIFFRQLMTSEVIGHFYKVVENLLKYI